VELIVVVVVLDIISREILAVLTLIETHRVISSGRKVVVSS